MHEYGLILGRFQPFHDGHASIVAEAIKHCEKLIIAIGSSQESRTIKNPFTWQERGAIIKYSIYFSERIIAIPIPDREVKMDDSSWGEYVMEEVFEKTGVRPTIIFEGAEEERAHWYDILDVEVEKIDRAFNPISATKIRQALLENDTDTFIKNMPSKTWDFYQDMRDIILEVYGK